MSLEPEIIPGTAWGRSIQGNPEKMNPANVTGMTVHYTGAPSVNTPKDQFASRLKKSQAGAHRSGIATIAYNFVIDKYGRIWEARGWPYMNAANGAKKGERSSNNWTFSVQVCVGVKDNAPTPEILAALQTLYRLGCARFGRPLTVTGHKDHKSTSCPGQELYRLVRSGLIAGAALDGTRPYTVVAGDNYIKVAQKTLGSRLRAREVKRLNNTARLLPGTIIRVPVQ